MRLRKSCCRTAGSAPAMSAAWMSVAYVFIEDRKKDMILVSGFNVYPNEVEAVAAAHPGVLEAAAVRRPDEHSGEVVGLFVVRKDPALTERPADRALPAVSHGLQGSEARIFQDRAAKIQRWQDIAARIAGGIGARRNRRQCLKTRSCPVRLAARRG